MLFNLYFANNALLSCFFFFFVIIDLYFLIAGVIAQIFNAIAELVMPIGIPSKEVKAEIEIHPVIVEAKIRKDSDLCFLQPCFKGIIHFQLNQESSKSQLILLL